MEPTDLDAVRERQARYTASAAHRNGFACCTAHATANDVPALLAEIERLQAITTASRRSVQVLSALEAFGVDNWGGYEEAMTSITE